MKEIMQPMIPVEIVEFYQELDQIHKKYIERGAPLKLTRSQKDSHQEQNVPLLNYVDFQLDGEKIKQAFIDVCLVIDRYRPQVKEALDKIQEELTVSVIDMRSLVEKFVWQDSGYFTEFLETKELDGELLSFVLFNVAKPFVTNYALRLEGQYPKELWGHNFCPVCGWKPGVAINTVKDNQRILRCSLCESDWSFKSMQCPHCLNEDHESLKYITIEDDEVNRVNVCDKCKGYIKSVNEGKLISIDNSFLMDVKTLYLDIIAEQQGYSKKINSLIKKECN